MTDYSVKRSWRRFLILPGYQYQFFGVFSVLGIALVVSNITTFYRFAWGNGQVLFPATAGKNIFESPGFAHLKVYLLLFLLLSILIFSVLFCVSIIYSHRSAGALYKIRQVLAQAKAGDKTARIHLRQSDEHKDLAEAINYLMNLKR